MSEREIPESHKTVPAAALLDLLNEQVRETREKNKRVLRIIEATGNEQSMADPTINFALGEIDGRRQIIEELAAYVITHSGIALGDTVPDEFLPPAE